MVKNVHMRQRRSAWPGTWTSRFEFDLPVEDTEVTKVDKRAASFVPRQTQDKNAMGNERFDNGSCLSFSLLYLFTFLPFPRLHVWNERLIICP